MGVTFDDELLEKTKLSESELKIEIAVMLYAKGKLTKGQASRFAGLTQLQFQKELADRNVPVNYGINELHEDIEALRKLNI